MVVPLQTVPIVTPTRLKIVPQLVKALVNTTDCFAFPKQVHQRVAMVQVAMLARAVAPAVAPVMVSAVVRKHHHREVPVVLVAPVEQETAILLVPVEGNRPH